MAHWLDRQAPLSSAGQGAGTGKLLHCLPLSRCFSLLLGHVLTIWGLCVVAAVVAVPSARAARRPAVLHLRRTEIPVSSHSYPNPSYHLISHFRLWSVPSFQSWPKCFLVIDSLRKNLTWADGDPPQNVLCGPAVPQESYHCCIECYSFTN